MRIMFINNDGAGFCDHIEIDDGLTVAEFFGRRMPDAEPADYLIRVNRLPVPRDQVLQPGDRVSFTPTRIEGASC